MNETRTIVPVQLNDTQKVISQPKQQENQIKPEQPACQLTINGAEVLFYNGIDKHILHAVLAEVRNAR